MFVFFPLTFNYFSRITTVTQENGSPFVCSSPISTLNSSLSGRVSLGKSQTVPRAPAASHARPRPRDPRNSRCLSPTGGEFIIHRRREITHSTPPSRGWRPRSTQNFSPTSPGRPGGFSQGDPSTFVFPDAHLLPPYLSFREAEAVCQLFSLCSYYIMVLLKGMFQSQ